MRTQQLETTQGDNADWQFQYFFNDAVVNLTGYTAEFKVVWGNAVSPLTGTTLINPGSVVGTTTKNNAQGIITASLSKTQTAQIPVSGAPNALTNASYQLRVTSPSGSVWTIVTGGLIVNGTYF